MRTQSFRRVLTATMVAALFYFSAGFGLPRAENSGSAALMGQVSSQEEGRMEGVLVSAKRAGSTITVTVVTDQQGRYSFPRNRLEPGTYSLRIRAVGYELNGPGQAEVTAQKTTQLDLKLRKAEDLASQLTNTEWLLSSPGTQQQKNALMRSCTTCHSLEPVFRSRYSASEWTAVLRKMLVDYRLAVSGGRSPSTLFPSPDKRPQEEHLSKINLNSGPQWAFSLQTLPRPKGRATRVIITEYDLPRPNTYPHDVGVDRNGVVWYEDFQHQYVGTLDPKTGQAVEYPVPEIKPGFPHGLEDLTFDKEGNVWFAMMVQGGIAEFERKTQKVRTWKLPPEVNTDVTEVGMVMPEQHHVDGKVWANNPGLEAVHRLDVQSGEIETFYPYRNVKDNRGHGVYGLAADSQNNLYFLRIDAEHVGKIDAKTGEITFYPTPTFDSGPRRGHMDSRDRLWFAEFRGNKVGMFDTRTKQFREWPLPTPWTSPYDAVLDKNGEAWSGGMGSDRVQRLDTKSGQVTEYLLPRYTNIRRVAVDNSSTRVAFWVGNNHGSSIVRLEPLD